MRITVNIPDDLERRVREAIVRLGWRKGGLSRAAAEALQLWLQKHEHASTQSDKHLSAQTGRQLSAQAEKQLSAQTDKQQFTQTEKQLSIEADKQFSTPADKQTSTQTPRLTATDQQKLRVNLVESVKITLLPWLDQLEVKESPAEIQVYRKGSLTPEEWSKINSSLKQLNAKWDPLKQAWIIPKTAQT